MVGGGHGSPPDRTDSEAEGAEIDAYVEAAREEGMYWYTDGTATVEFSSRDCYCQPTIHTRPNSQARDAPL